MTSDLFVIGGFRKANIWKNLFGNNYEREKGPYLQFRKLCYRALVVTIDWLKGKQTKHWEILFFIYDPFHEASYRDNLNEIRYPLTFVPDCCDLMNQSFVKVNFAVVDVPQAPTKALAGHYAIIFAYCKLQGVSFKKLVLPHNDIGKSLYTFLKDGYIPEVLLINTNSNGGKIHYNFNKYCTATVTNKVSVVRMKECDRCHNWFHKVCEAFNCEDQISKVNSEIQWFCR